MFRLAEIAQTTFIEEKRFGAEGIKIHASRMTGM
jgi:hypothetical protein